MHTIALSFASRTEISSPFALLMRLSRSGLPTSDIRCDRPMARDGREAGAKYSCTPCIALNYARRLASVCLDSGRRARATRRAPSWSLRSGLLRLQYQFNCKHPLRFRRCREICPHARRTYCPADLHPLLRALSYPVQSIPPCPSSLTRLHCLRCLTVSATRLCVDCCTATLSASTNLLSTPRSGR